MAKLAPYTAMGPVEHYRERLREIGRLAARLDEDDRHPLEVMIDFFEIDEHDRRIVETAFLAEPGLDTDDKVA
jgi:hypothetical protein